jgi:hypothetical protein
VIRTPAWRRRWRIVRWSCREARRAEVVCMRQVGASRGRDPAAGAGTGDVRNSTREKVGSGGRVVAQGGQRFVNHDLTGLRMVEQARRGPGKTGAKRRRGKGARRQRGTAPAGRPNAGMAQKAAHRAMVTPRGSDSLGRRSDRAVGLSRRATTLR